METFISFLNVSKIVQNKGWHSHRQKPSKHRMPSESDLGVRIPDTASGWNLYSSMPGSEDTTFPEFIQAGDSDTWKNLNKNKSEML